MKGRPSTYGPPGDQFSVNIPGHPLVERAATPLELHLGEPEEPVHESSAGVGVINVNDSPQPFVILQPSNSIGFDRAYFFLSSDFSPHSHIRHPPRSSDTERHSFPKHHKPQCRSCIIQNQDECSQGAPFSCLNVSSPHLYPQLYAVRPNSGKVNPGQIVEVQGAISLLVFNAVG